MPAKGSPAVKIRFPRPDMERLQAAARAQAVDVASLVRHAVLEHLGSASSPSPVSASLPADTPARPVRKPTRLQRLKLLRQDLRVLLESYQEWQDGLPDSLTESPTAEKLQETVDALQAVTDQLEDVEPPRGFGRD